MIVSRRSIPAPAIKLLIWDLDGTLVDSQLDLAQSVNAMLRHFKRPELPVPLLSTYVGDGAAMLVQRALGQPTDAQMEADGLEFFIDHYSHHLLDHTVAYPGVRETLAHIRQHGGRQMAVLSNKPVRLSREICHGLQLAPCFTQIYGGNSFATKKPDPLGAQKLMRECGVEPAETVMIGDSHNDVLTAVHAGMYSVGVTYGLSPESLRRHSPDVLIDNPPELLQVLELDAPSHGPC